VRRLALLLIAAFALSGCGEQPAPATEPRVKLKLTAPDDGSTTFDERIVVRGTVTPANAAVRVAGTDAAVEAGQFSAEVELDPGGNVIDVTAAAPGRRPATDAVRVERDMRVAVPALVGLEYDDAAARLEDAGLKAEEERGGNWLDRLLAGTYVVCASRPPEGERVDRGTTVTLETAPEC
jgi:beta-lactam-binding protein with PASTA domain